MNYPTNYELPQWEAGDRVKRADMNGAMSAIDAALAGAGGAKIAYGTYIGTGEYGPNHQNSLTFDFEPKLFIVQYKAGPAFSDFNGIAYVPAIVLRGTNAAYLKQGVYENFFWEGNTISWFNDNAEIQQHNAHGATYFYIAIG